MKPAPRRGRTPHAVRIAAPSYATNDTHEEKSATSPRSRRLALKPRIAKAFHSGTTRHHTRRRAIRHDRSGRYTSLCRSTHEPSLTLRVHPFFCCQHTQVKHPCFAVLSTSKARHRIVGTNGRESRSHVLVREALAPTSSPLYAKCPLEFSVHQSKH